MPRRSTALIWLALTTAVAATSCGGGGGGSSAGAGAGAASAASSSTTAVPSAVTSTTSTTMSPIEGVQTFAVDSAGHTAAPVSYPQVPPVGGNHNPVWEPCAFYDAPIPNELGVHSLEHGAIWITYRPDLPAADVDLLAAFARGRKDIVASRWDTGLPSPLVASAWGRQLRLQSFSDPRLAQFVQLYAGQGPEKNVPC